jgi:hypothetical protein
MGFLSTEYLPTIQNFLVMQQSAMMLPAPQALNLALAALTDIEALRVRNEVFRHQLGALQKNLPSVPWDVEDRTGIVHGSLETLEEIIESKSEFLSTQMERWIQRKVNLELVLQRK